MDDLKLIKKHYGEKMMHLCRDSFSSILDKEGFLFKLLSEHFDYSKNLYDDIINNNLVNSFVDYIIGLSCISDVKTIETDKTPQELMDEAGYILYECHDEKEIQAFKHYYDLGEELCTFNGGRLDYCHVFFAVKKDVDKIKKSINPKREDDYGTSVISIQFSKGNYNGVSIKNRYNLAVKNADDTFNNNLEEIMPGLTKAFEKKYNLNTRGHSFNFQIPNYIHLHGEKYYKYNYEINDIYYCCNNLIIDNYKVVRDYMEKERYVLLDYFILDLKEKTIKLYDNNIIDGFVNDFLNINKIDVQVDKKTNIKKIVINDEIEIDLNNENIIVGYKNHLCRQLGESFLRYNRDLKKFDCPNVHVVQNDCLRSNRMMESLYLPNLKEAGNNFMMCNNKIVEISFPFLKQVGDSFFYNDQVLKSIYAPNLEITGDCFCTTNRELKELDFPNLKSIGNNFMIFNNGLRVINFPQLDINYYRPELSHFIEYFDNINNAESDCSFKVYKKTIN